MKGNWNHLPVPPPLEWPHMDTRKWTKGLLRLPSSSCDLLPQRQSPLLSLPPLLFLHTKASAGLAGLLPVRAGWRCLGKGLRLAGPSVERHLAHAPLHVRPCADLTGSCTPPTRLPELLQPPSWNSHPSSQPLQRGNFPPTALALWVFNCDSLNLGLRSPKKTPRGGWGSHPPMPKVPGIFGITYILFQVQIRL